MEIDVAGQISKLVQLFSSHPAASIGAVIAILLILGFQKEGLFSKIFAYMEAKETKEAAKEERRMEIIRLMHERAEPLLPGIETREERQ